MVMRERFLALAPC